MTPEEFELAKQLLPVGASAAARKLHVA